MSQSQHRVEAALIQVIGATDSPSTTISQRQLIARTVDLGRECAIQQVHALILGLWHETTKDGAADSHVSIPIRNELWLERAVFIKAARIQIPAV